MSTYDKEYDPRDFGPEPPHIANPPKRTEQEPVAWRWETHNGYAYSEQHYEGENGQPLYTHPPKRTWVGLTDEEAQQTFARHNCTISTHLAGILTRAIEAKLKEKNSA